MSEEEIQVELPEDFVEVIHEFLARQAERSDNNYFTQGVETLRRAKHELVRICNLFVETTGESGNYILSEGWLRHLMGSEGSVPRSYTDHLSNCISSFYQKLEIFQNFLAHAQAIFNDDNPIEKAAEIAREASSSRRICTPENFYRELHILQDHYGDRLSFRSNYPFGNVYAEDDEDEGGYDGYSTGSPEVGRCILVRTEPISFSEAGVTVNFEGFYLVINMDRLVMHVNHSSRILDCVKVLPYGEPNSSHDGYLHPHVESDGIVCFGDAGSAVANALANGLISDAMFLIENLISTYNPSGPFRKVRDWYGPRLRCGICNESFTPDEVGQRSPEGSYPFCLENVVVLGEGEQSENLISEQESRYLVHRNCASFDEEDQVFYNPSDTVRCIVCCERFRHTRIGNVHYDFVPNIDDVGQHSVASVCRGCGPRFDRQVEAASQGIYQCPVCDARYEGDAIDENIVKIRDHDWGCRRCCVRNDNGSITVHERNSDGEEHVRYVPSAASRSRAVARPLPFLNRPVRCTCGESVPSADRRPDEITGDYRCSTCDPDNLGFSQTFRQDKAYMELWFREKVRVLTDDFTRDFIEFASFYDPDFTAGIAFTVVKNMVLRSRRAGAEYDNKMLLQEKLDWWNGLTNDPNITLVRGVEEQMHDEQVIREWRRHASRGSERFQRRLAEIEGTSEARRTSEAESSPDDGYGEEEEGYSEEEDGAY